MGCTTKQDAVDRALREKRRREIDGILATVCPLCNELYGAHTRESCPPGVDAALAHFDEKTREFYKEVL